MPQQLGAPGVYIEEVPSGRRTIRSVATSIGAFVDFFREGPMNTPVRIFGTGDFERVFGGYDSRSEASFAIPQFFLNGGTEAWVIRVAAGSPDASEVVIQDETPSNVLTVRAANPGLWGDSLRVGIDHDVVDGDAADLRFNLRVSRHSGTDGNAPVLVGETFLDLSLDPDSPRFVDTIVNDGSLLVQVEADGGADGTTRPAANGTTGAALDLDDTAFDTLGGGQTLDMSVDSVTATATLTWNGGDVTSLSQLRGRVEAAIRAADPGNPTYAAARVTLANSRLRLLTGRSGAAYDPDHTITVTGGTAEGTLGLAAATAFAAAQQYELDGGDSGQPPAAAELIGSSALEPPTGMFALDNVDLFNTLMIPRAAELSDTDMHAVYSNAIAYCEDRRAMVIVDLPPGVNTLADMTDLMADLEQAGFRSENAAIYYPRPRIPDPTNDFRLRTVGASGTLGGVWARTDTARGVWKAPAGIETGLQGVSELETQVNDGQNGVLNPLGINALRTFPVYGTISWGSRTLVGADALASEWAYIPVRRTALMLEESLFRGTQWVVFEPNDEPTWATIRMNIGAFLNGLFQQGAFQGASPKDAYYVKCDSETTTQNHIDQGIVNIEVGFAPLKPAEFVVIRFRQIVGQVEVQEGPVMPIGFTVNAHRYDPYKNFRFQVSLDGRVVMGVSKVGALKRSTEVVNYRSGGGNTYDFKSPGRTKYEAITMERGLTHDPDFEDWAASVHPHDGSSNALLAQYKKDFVLNLLNLQGQVAKSYFLMRCWVSDYTAMPDLDGGQNGVAIESITLQPERWERDLSVTEPSEGQAVMALTVWAVPGREGEAMVARPFGIGMVDMTVDFDRPLTGVISAILQSCLSSAEGTSWTGAELAGWTIPRQRQGLLAVAVATNGARRVFETECGACGEMLDVEVDLTMFRQDWSVEETGFGGGRLRLPRASDLARSGGDPQALAELLLDGEAPGEGWQEEAGEVLAELDPLSDVELESVCPDCGANVEMPLSLEMELVTELAREPLRLMDEIHMIAMAYNWSEREIISLPDSRRRHYLTRIQEAWAA